MAPLADGPGGGGAPCPPPSEPTPRPRCPQINLNKGDEYWWNAILEGEEQIDIDKINKERSMATVDEEEHAVLDRLTFDYHQKLQGKPQSHELVGAPPQHPPGCWALGPSPPSLPWLRPAARPRSSLASLGMAACGICHLFGQKNGGLGPAPA